MKRGTRTMEFGKAPADGPFQRGPQVGRGLRPSRAGSITPAHPEGSPYQSILLRRRPFQEFHKGLSPSANRTRPRPSSSSSLCRTSIEDEEEDEDDEEGDEDD
jgi:hypothetical protein